MKVKRERYIEMLIGPHSGKAKMHLKEIFTYSSIQAFKATSQSVSLWLLRQKANAFIYRSKA